MAPCRLLPHNTGITLPKLPGGLITQPTLAWDINVAARRQPPGTRVTIRRPASHGGLTITSRIWKDAMRIRAVSISVHGSASSTSRAQAIPQAKLKLVAGDVQRARPMNQPAAPMLMARKSANAEERDAFAEKSFFEYHLYTLGPRYYAAGQFDEADRAVSGRTQRAMRKRRSCITD